MKLLMAIYNVVIDEEVMEALEKIGVFCFTKWPRVLGRGRKTGPRLDSHIWPGANTVSIFILEDDISRKALEEMRKLRDEMGHEGIKAFILPVEDQIG